MEKYIKLSVHQLVDFLLRKGDIDNRVFNSSSMAEGSRMHKEFQNEQKPDSGYEAEYYLSHLFHIDGVDVFLQGYADGIFPNRYGEYTIEEIKTTVEELKIYRDENIAWHLGQVKCYAFMFAFEKNLPSISIRLHYIRQGKNREHLTETYTYLTSELEQEVTTYLEDYLDFYNIIFRLNEEKIQSISKLEFPFSSYRDGQRDLAKYAYSLAKKGGRLFVEAPTGIGKTMSTLFPFIKTLQDDEQSKIFYLTAKTSGKESAAKAMNLLKDSGLIINHIIITAKEKICPNSQRTCNPDECPFAKGYYSKLQGVLRYALTHYSTFDLDKINELAFENMMCPFELQLDLSLFCDVIICDYNYLFDPITYMKRYFDEDSSHFLALVDEAHNLVDRSRDMYSASIKQSTFLEARKAMRKTKHPLIKRRMSALRKFFEDLDEAYDIGDHTYDNFKDEDYRMLALFTETYLDINKNEHNVICPELTTLYLEINRFLRIGELYNEKKYLTYITKTEDDLKISYFCLDASSFLSSITRRIKASLFFSGTLSPIDYYVTTLGGSEEDARLMLPSPFPKENFKIMIAPKISTKYKNREASYELVKEYILSFIGNKVGNYFIYSPSYEYMNRILDGFTYEEGNIYIQKQNMSEKEKENFLLNFVSNPQKTNIGFLVIGGAFGEGVDLVSDRLIGAVIIGIGLPKTNFASDAIAEYFKEEELPGYEYAYTNPGMNKVMQAVGRVIRSEDDLGAALLIDERYLYRQYRDLFKSEWSHYSVVYSPKEVEEELANFFDKKK